MRKVTRLALVALVGGLLGYFVVAVGLRPTSGTGGPRDRSPLPVEAKWTAFDDLPLGTPPRLDASDAFDQVRSGMTLEEIVQLLGRGWMYGQVEGCGIISWSCADGREFPCCRVGLDANTASVDVCTWVAENSSPAARRGRCREV